MNLSMDLLTEFKRYLLQDKVKHSKITVKNYVSDVRKFINWFENTFHREFLPELITKLSITLSPALVPTYSIYEIQKATNSSKVLILFFLYSTIASGILKRRPSVMSFLYLGYFEFVQHRINGLKSGDSIFICDEGCKNNKGELVLKFSRSFLEKLSEIKQSGFQLKEAKVNFIVYWTNDDKKEVKIVLPELCFEKNI